MDTADCIVIDIGSGYIKAGWAGEDAPRYVVPTVLIDDAMQSGHFIGEDAFHALSNSTDEDLSLIHPIDRGEITNWDSMKKLWDHIFYKELNLEKLDECPVLITVPPLSSREMRNTIADTMFRQFNVNSLCLYNAAVLSLYSTGRTRGLVVETGEGLTHTVPVFEGYALPHATQKMNLAGQDLTERLLHILEQRKHVFTDADVDIVRDIKEKMVAVSLEPKFDPVLLAPAGQSSASECTYELPDGVVIQMDDQCRHSIAEILFRPKMFDYQNQGIHEMTFDSIIKCDEYLQRDLYSNIVVSGGTSMLKGFPERMMIEMKNLSGESCELYPDSQRKYAAWTGGSMLASLSTFNSLKITAAEYAEADEIVHKKFFG